jgi:hypothetical protein
MKFAPTFFAAAFGLFLGPAASRSEEPAFAVPPGIRALLAELLETADQLNSEPVPVVYQVSVPLPARMATTSQKPVLGSASSLKTNALATRSLGNTGLTLSSLLNGRGTAGGLPRLTNEEWRLLFPNRSIGQ